MLGDDAFSLQMLYCMLNGGFIDEGKISPKEL